MKPLHIIIPAALGLLLSSCNLDTTPQDRYDQESFWFSRKAAEGGLAGCYNILLSNGIFGRAAVYWEDDATPNGYNFSNDDHWTTIAGGSQTATTGGIIGNRWAHAYAGIGRCNTLLDNIGVSKELSAAEIGSFKNQARFLRVLYYYMLTTYYGDCPLITTTPVMEHKSLPRTPRAEVISFMLEELKNLSEVLPPKAGGGRPTAGAALALKARILLFEASPLLNPENNTEKWREAANAALAVMECDGGYDLFRKSTDGHSPYRSLFLEANEDSCEAIFNVECINVNKLGLSFELIARQYGTMAPLRDLIDFYCDMNGKTRTPGEQYLDPARIDPRFTATIVYPGCKFMGATVAPTQFQQTGCTIKKYTVYDEHTPTAAEKSIGDTESPIDYMVFRYADILLMYAEAKNELGELDKTVWDQTVRAIRERAGFTAASALDYPGNNQAALRKAIRYERRAEFVGEGYYYNDLRRWKEAENVNNGPIRKFNNEVILVRNFEPSRDYWWPVPQGEIDLNANLLPNNPNY